MRGPPRLARWYSRLLETGTISLNVRSADAVEPVNGAGDRDRAGRD